MRETPNIDLDELNQLVYTVINEAAPEERQAEALNRIIDILTGYTDYAKNVIRCSVCGGDRLSVARIDGGSPSYYQCAVCYAEDMLIDGQVDE
jgi:hypothetical protein